MGPTTRIALIALVTATALGGCSSAQDQAVVPAALDEVVETGAQTADFCTAAQANVDAGAALEAFVSAAPPPRTREEVAGVLEPVREANAQMLAAAPEMARADLEQVAELAELKLAAFEASGGDPAAVVADPAIAEKTAAATEPSARIRQYLRGVCRIAPN